MVHDKLVWDQHVDYISSKITRSICFLKRIRHFIPQESLLLLYHTLIGPYFRYCSIVWDNVVRPRRIISRLQQAARTIAKLRFKEANHSDLLTEFTWLSVRNLIKLDSAVFVHKEVNNLHPERAHFKCQIACAHITLALLVIIIYSLLSEGRTVVKSISECNQSGRRVVFYLESVAMSTTFCSASALWLFQQPCVMKVIPRMLPRISLRNCGSSHCGTGKGQRTSEGLKKD